MNDLASEWVQAAEAGWQDPRLERWFAANGIAINHLSAFGFDPGVNVIGLANIDVDPGGFYQPHPDGKPAIIMPTCIRDEDMEPDDLIAWRTDSPQTVWRRTGYSDVLDPWSVFRATIETLDETLIVHETPLDWLKAGCRGCVVLNWSDRLFLTFSGVRNIVADLPFRSVEYLEHLISPKAHGAASISIPNHRSEEAA